MLAGRHGRAVQWALETQLACGQYFHADGFVPVTNAHVVADVEVMGTAGRDLLAQFTEEGAHFAVPTTTNTQFTDPAHAALMHQDLGLVDEQEHVTKLLVEMGAVDVRTCIPYQSTYQPHLGEHVAWGDTGTVCYSNSVFGSRSNFEAGAASIAAALTGRVPNYGFHLDQHRTGTRLVHVETPLQDYADWGALGAYVGRACGNYWEVPVLDGIGEAPTSDELKHLAAALASYGSVAMFGISEYTPEADDLKQRLLSKADRSRDILRVAAPQLDSVYEGFRASSDDADVVVFSGPQQSLFELRVLAEALDGKQIHDNTQLIITTNHGYLQLAERLGYAQTIRRAGGTILAGACFYVLGLEDLKKGFGWHTVVTNSAKVANIIGYVFEPVLRRTDACIQSALTGKVVAHG